MQNTAARGAICRPAARTVAAGRQILANFMMVTLIAMLGIALPARAEEVWETALRLQLVAEKNCQLALIVSVRRIPVDGLDALEGRARCIDNREFDFSQPKQHQKFTLQLCQPAVC